MHHVHSNLGRLAAALFVQMAACLSGCRGGDSVGLIQSDTPPVAVSGSLEHEFYWLEVMENRDDPNTGTVRVPVYRFQSLADDPEPDPVVIMLGGPGLPTSTIAPYMRAYRYLEHRDVLLVDQRGTRFGEPALECPEWTGAVANGADEQTLAAAASACAERLVSDGVDLNGYNALEIARDLRDLRKALGVERWNLVTTSYSTKVAQLLLRIDGNAVRSAVLDSPMPLDRRYDEEYNTNLVAVIERVLADCESDPDCRAAYPGLRGGLTELLTTETEAQRAAVFDAFSLGEPGPDPQRWERLWGVLDHGSPGSDTSGPDGTNAGGTGFAMGMRLAAWASEEYAYTDAETVLRERTRYPILGETSPSLFFESVMQAVGVRAADPIVVEPVAADTPVLVLVGGYDPLTPPRWARHLANSMPNARVIEFAGWGHGPLFVWDGGIGIGIADAFVQDPSGPLPQELVELAGSLRIGLP